MLFWDLRREYGKDNLILDNVFDRLENTIAVPLLNSFASLFSFLTMTLLRALDMLQGYSQYRGIDMLQGYWKKMNLELTEDRNELGRMLITICELAIFFF